MAPPLLHYQVRPSGRVLSQYGVSGGYWGLRANHSFPEAGILARARWRGQPPGDGDDGSCWAAAKAHREPFSDFYAPRGAPPQPLPGGTPRTAWQWGGRISRQLFESVPFILRDRHGCHHCTYVLRYKVLGGRLFTDRARRGRDLSGQEDEAEMIEEMMLAALHLFEVPDADLLVHLGDGAPEGLPLLQANIDRGVRDAGFAIPKRMWSDALGPEQMALLAECLEVRYPRDPPSRTPLAVWRGSNTDLLADPMDESNALGAARSRLHLMGRWYPHLLDAAVTGYPQRAFETQCVEALLPPGGKMAREGFNRYAVVLDVDGNGWSDRFRLLAHYNTPVLKQASNLTAFFEHLMAPGISVEHYSPSLHDLPVRAEALLQEWRRDPSRLWRMAEQRQGLAALTLNQVAVVEAMAYAVARAAELSNWAPREEAGYDPVPFSRCCPRAPALPAGFVEAVRATRPRGGGGGGGNGVTPVGA